MQRPRIGTLLLAWLVAEAVVLAIVVHVIGVGGAILLGVATSLVGAVALRGLGRAATAALRRGFAIEHDAQLLDGGLAALGAALLLLPGFMSDLAGLALLAPALRHEVTTRLLRRRATDVVELDPGDWRRLDETR